MWPRVLLFNILLYNINFCDFSALKLQKRLNTRAAFVQFLAFLYTQSINLTAQSVCYKSERKKKAQT